MATFTKLPSGSWRAQIRKSGITKSASFILKRDAVDWANRVEASISDSHHRGYIKPQSATTIAKLILAYEAQLKSCGRSKSAVLKSLRESNLGDVKLNQLSPIHLGEFIDTREKTAGGVTIAVDLSYLGAVLKWARESKRLDVNPALALDARASLKHRGLNTRAQSRTRIPTEAELNRLCKFFDSRALSKVPMSDIVRFATSSAMRLGEICRLQVEDLGKDFKTIVIRKRKHPDPTVKEHNDQVVPLLGSASEIAKRMVNNRTEGKLFERATEVAVGAAFTRAVQTLGIEDLRFHDLRHHGITALFKAGLRIEQVAVVSGHRDWKMLKRYTHLQADDVIKAYEALK
jgi:integrase